MLFRSGALVEPAVPQAETPHVCTVESGCLTLLCEHREGGAHSADCGYAEAVEGRPCGFVCPICTAAAGEISVTGWTWADEEKVLTEAGGRWYLALPGAGEDHPAMAEELAALLPQGVSADLADGTSAALELTWDLEAFPAQGAWEGSWPLRASLPAGYALGENVPAPEITVTLSGGEVYREVPIYVPASGTDPKADSTTKIWDGKINKFVSEWKYVPVDNNAITSRDEQYFLSLNIINLSDASLEELIKRVKAALPQKICCYGYYAQNLIDAGFKLGEGQPTTGKVSGYVDITWNVETVMTQADLAAAVFTFDAKPVSTTGHTIRVNTNDANYKDNKGDAADTAETDGILNLTVTLHEVRLEDHVVAPASPEGVTVNLFDYWVGESGANGGNDLLPKNDWHYNTGTPPLSVARTGVDDWNKGINEGHLLLFGDGNIHAGFWNKGAGAVSEYGKSHAGMSGIVENTLVDGYPVVDIEAAEDQVDSYEGISDWKLCGDRKSVV